MSMILSSDSAPFIKRGYKGDFYSPLGVSLLFKDEKYKEKYTAYCKELDSKYDIPSSIIFKAYDFMNIFKLDSRKYIELSEEFINFLFSNKVEIFIYYFIIDKKMLPKDKKIRMYTHGKSKSIDPLQFSRDKMSNYFHSVCCWKTLEDHPEIDTKILLDNFQGPKTDSWKELSDKCEIEIIPEGDKVNSYISSADILVKYIDLKLKEMNYRISDKNIKKIFKTLREHEVNCNWVGNPQLSKVVPLKEKYNILTRNYYIKPMIYVIKEKGFNSEVIKKTPGWSSLLEFAYDSDAGVKVYSSKEDILRKDDILVYYGKSGKELAESMDNLYGNELKILNIVEIQNKTS